MELRALGRGNTYNYCTTVDHTWETLALVLYVLAQDVSVYGKGAYLQPSAGRLRPLICPSASATLFEPLSTCHASPSYTHSAEPPQEVHGLL